MSCAASRRRAPCCRIPRSRTRAKALDTQSFFQVEQFLPIFGSRGALLRAGAAATLAAEAERDGRLWQLRADARTLVARLLAEQEKLEASAVDGPRGRAHHRAAADSREGRRGIALRSRCRAEQELADARQISLEAAASAAEVRAAIAAVVADGTRIDARRRACSTSIAPIPAVDTLSARALTTRGELRALSAASERFRLEADAARRAKAAGAHARRRTEARRRRRRVARAEACSASTSRVPLFDSGGREAARWLAERDRTEAERALTHAKHPRAGGRDERSARAAAGGHPRRRCRVAGRRARRRSQKFRTPKAKPAFSSCSMRIAPRRARASAPSTCGSPPASRKSRSSAS